MEIVVCVKQVPDTTEVKIDPVTNTSSARGYPASSTRSTRTPSRLPFSSRKSMVAR